jgi:hypothetical protein
MKTNSLAIAIATLALVGVFLMGALWHTQTAAERIGFQDLPTPASAARVARLEAQIDLLKRACWPELGQIMNVIAVHFSKLYFAVEADNWPLAKFELKELEENLERVPVIQPVEKGVQMAGVIDSFQRTQLTDLEDAMDQHNVGQFRRIYSECVAMCNGCHKSTAHPFIQITVPSAPPVGNQSWKVTAQ